MPGTGCASSLASAIDVQPHDWPWHLDRTRGGLRVIMAQQERGRDDDVWHEGNAGALSKTRDLIGAFDPDVLMVLSADHVSRLDNDTMGVAHRPNG